MEFSPISDTNNTDKHERSILLASIKSEEETSVTDLTNRALAYYKEHTAQIEVLNHIITTAILFLHIVHCSQ